MNRLQCR